MENKTHEGSAYIYDGSDLLSFEEEVDEDVELLAEFSEMEQQPVQQIGTPTAAAESRAHVDVSRLLCKIERTLSASNSSSSPRNSGHSKETSSAAAAAATKQQDASSLLDQFSTMSASSSKPGPKPPVVEKHHFDKLVSGCSTTTQRHMLISPRSPPRHSEPDFVPPPRRIAWESSPSVSRRDDPRRLLGGYGVDFTIGRQALASPPSVPSVGGDHSAMTTMGSGSVATDLVEIGAVAAGREEEASTTPRGDAAGATTAIAKNAEHCGRGGQSLSSCSDTGSVFERDSETIEGVGSSSGGVGVGDGGIGVSSSKEKHGPPRLPTAPIALSTDPLASCAAATASETTPSSRQSSNLLQNPSPAGVPRDSCDAATTSSENSPLSDERDAPSSIKNASSSACKALPKNNQPRCAISRWGDSPPDAVRSPGDDAKVRTKGHMRPPPPPPASSGSDTVLRCDRSSENREAPLPARDSTAAVTKDTISRKQSFATRWGQDSNQGASDDPAAVVAEEPKPSPRSRPKLWHRTSDSSSSRGRISLSAKGAVPGSRWDRKPDPGISNGGAAVATANQKKTCSHRSTNSESLHTGGGDKSSAGIMSNRSDTGEKKKGDRKPCVHGDKELVSPRKRTGIPLLPVKGSSELKAGGGPFAHLGRELRVSSSAHYKPAPSGRGIGQGRERNSRSSERRSSLREGEPRRGSTPTASPSFREGNRDTGRRSSRDDTERRGSRDHSARKEHVVRSRDTLAKDKPLTGVDAWEHDKGRAGTHRATLQWAHIHPREQLAYPEAAFSSRQTRARLAGAEMTPRGTRDNSFARNTSRRCSFSGHRVN